MIMVNTLQMMKETASILIEKEIRCQEELEEHQE